MGFWVWLRPGWGQKPSCPAGSRTVGHDRRGGSAQTCLPQMPGEEAGRVGKGRPALPRQGQSRGLENPIRGLDTGGKRPSGQAETHREGTQSAGVKDGRSRGEDLSHLPGRDRPGVGAPPPRQERGWEGLLSTLSQTGLTRPLRASHRCHPQQPSLAAKALDHHDCRWKWPPHTAGPLLCGGSLQGWGQHPG